MQAHPVGGLAVFRGFDRFHRFSPPGESWSFKALAGFPVVLPFQNRENRLSGQRG
jgi:hypothetical protein